MILKVVFAYFANKPNLFWGKTKIINIVNKYDLSRSILKKMKRFYMRSKIKKNFCNEPVFKEFCSNYRTERLKKTDSYLVVTHREKKKYQFKSSIINVRRFVFLIVHRASVEK